jgi:putative ABC transport system ATP-binding protein
MKILEDIHKQGNTVILVTHEPDIAEHAHRIIRLRDGEVESDIKNDNIVSVDDPTHRYLRDQ